MFDIKGEFGIGGKAVKIINKKDLCVKILLRILPVFFNLLSGSATAFELFLN